MPCKRGAKKYCSRECCLKNTAIGIKNKRFSIEKNTIPWNKGIKYSPELKSRLNVDGLKLGIGYWKGKERLNLRGDRLRHVIRNCMFCSNEMKLAPWQVRDNKKFCSPKCYQAWHRGDNSPVYKGDKAVSRLRNRIAQLPEYREWHATIMKRDGYKCTLCGCVHSKERPLEVDHIKRFLTIAQENSIFTPDDARNCKELWDISNGRTICRICHRTLDTYGTKGLKKLINLT